MSLPYKQRLICFSSSVFVCSFIPSSTLFPTHYDFLFKFWVFLSLHVRNKFWVWSHQFFFKIFLVLQQWLWIGCMQMGLLSSYSLKFFVLNSGVFCFGIEFMVMIFPLSVFFFFSFYCPVSMSHGQINGPLYFNQVFFHWSNRGQFWIWGFGFQGEFNLRSCVTVSLSLHAMGCKFW